MMCTIWVMGLDDGLVNFWGRSSRARHIQKEGSGSVVCSHYLCIFDDCEGLELLFLQRHNAAGTGLDGVKMGSGTRQIVLSEETGCGDFSAIEWSI
jgi:hypothetical protein